MKKSKIAAIALLLSAGLSAGALADEAELSKDAMDKILKALSGIGCTEIKGEGEDEGGHYELDDVICQGSSYDIQIDKDLKIITMVRDPGS